MAPTPKPTKPKPVTPKPTTPTTPTVTGNTVSLATLQKRERELTNSPLMVKVKNSIRTRPERRGRGHHRRGRDQSR